MDRVACGGAECAYHAEYIATPDLLTAHVPDAVPNWQAAYTTLCAIALQAVRRAEIQLGDRVVAMGQGLVGLLVTNLLRVGGARVMAVDVIPSRRALCPAMGAERAVIAGEQNLSDEVRLWTDGFGADAAVICTATHGYSFAAGVAHRNIFGVQFHPEKSHVFGRRVLENFAAMDVCLGAHGAPGCGAEPHV